MIENRLLSRNLIFFHMCLISLIDFLLILFMSLEKDVLIYIYLLLQLILSHASVIKLAECQDGI